MRVDPLRASARAYRNAQLPLSRLPTRQRPLFASGVVVMVSDTRATGMPKTYSVRAGTESHDSQLFLRVRHSAIHT